MSVTPQAARPSVEFLGRTLPRDPGLRLTRLATAGHAAGPHTRRLYRLQPFSHAGRPLLYAPIQVQQQAADFFIAQMARACHCELRTPARAQSLRDRRILFFALLSCV